MLKDNLTMLRKLNGYSQEQISEKINISRQAYAKWESGATIPDIEKAALLAQVYGVSLDSLMKTETMEDGGLIPPAPRGKNIFSLNLKIIFSLPFICRYTIQQVLRKIKSSP